MAEHHQPRWILVGGLGLTATLWVLQSLTTHLSHLGQGLGLPLSVAVLGGWLWWQKRSSVPSVMPTPSPTDRGIVEKEWTIVDQLLEQLQEELPSLDALPADYQTQRHNLHQQIDRPHLTLAITGSPRTGKTSLLNLLRKTLGEEIHWVEAALSDPSTLQASDGVIVLTAGDLTQSELDHLQVLADHPAVVIAVNKKDHYLPDALPLLIAQIQSHLQNAFPKTVDIPVLTIATQPNPIKRHKIQPDGTSHTILYQPDPAITPLLQAITPWLQSDRATALVCATTYRQTQVFKKDLHDRLNQLRREEALTLIQKSQGIAAVAVALNPIASLDLLATLAITGQLVVDLARLYHQPLTLQQGETIASTLTSLLLKLGLVELSTQTLSTVLKTHHTTYVAGAILQGISAAYLTRMAGLTIVTYLESLEPGSTWNQTHWNDRLQTLLQSTFQKLQQPNFLRSFTQTLLPQIPRLSTESEKI